MAHHYDVDKDYCDFSLQKKNDKLTEMLCRLYRNCEGETMKLIDKDIQEWMETYQEQIKKQRLDDIRKVEQSLTRLEGDIQSLQRQEMALKDKLATLQKI